jgi:hypothetical protein
MIPGAFAHSTRAQGVASIAGFELAMARVWE